MPFGWGPRSCIGLRFALLETKIALMEILRKFSFARAPETVVCICTVAYSIRIESLLLYLIQANLQQLHGFTSYPKGGVWLKIVARD